MNQILTTIIVSVLASTGIWTVINNLITAHREKKSESTKMLLGLGHDRIYELSLFYIQRGSISSDEYENLIKYLYEPYKKLGGNGTAERLIAEVKKLPIVEPNK